LADVSHLFLSQTDAVVVPCKKAASEDPESAPAATEEGDGVALLRPCPQVTREWLTRALIGNMEAFEAGMTVIDVNAPSGAEGTIDVLGVDADRRLTIIDFDTEPYDGLLLRAIGHFDWLTRHATVARHMYHGHDIDHDVRPRIVLVAPGFSPLLKAAARHVTCTRIDWFTYRAVQVPGGQGLMVDRL